LLLEIHTGAADSASTCAILTPAIKSRLREMQSGQVLEVRVDDPSAKEDIEAWSRLSGNPLVGMSNGEGPELRFFVKKK
jgi:TusA-related sulfurtransferase